MKCPILFTNIWRKKTIVTSNLHDTKLRRCLGLMDLVGLGLGSSLGLGVYVITSYATRNEAGPAFVISVILAGVAALFSGLCYAEFAARLPRAGSAYLYSYVALGEMCGFVVGWNLILEYIIGAAAAAKAWSQYMDFMTNDTVHNYFSEHVRWAGGTVISDFPDFLAFGILIFVTLLVSLGTKLTSTVNIVLVFLNMLVVTCFVCVGYFHVKHENWTDPPGFFPHGFQGILAGAATLFVTFANFEVITSSSEEVREPSRTVPTAIMCTVFLCSAVYFCVSTSMTLSLHCDLLNSTASLPKMLQSLNVHGASWIVSVGGLIGLTASALGACFYIPRILYSMASDRLLFKLFADVSERTYIPVYSTLISGCIAACFALSLRLEFLLQLLSLGILIAYTSVAISLLCVRYQAGTVGLYMEYEDPDDLNFVQCTDFIFTDFKTDGARSGSSHSLQGAGSVQLHEKSSLCNGYSNHAAHGDTGISLDGNSKRCNSRRGNAMATSPSSSSAKHPKGSTYRKMDSIVSSTSNGSISGLFRLPSDVAVEPNEATWRTAGIGLVMFICCSVILCLSTLYGDKVAHLNSWWVLLLIFAFIGLLVSATVLIAKQPQNRTKLLFRTPYVPFVPLVSILVNIYLLAALPQSCWVRFLIWMFLGMIVYFSYGYRKSMERDFDEQEVILYEISDAGNSQTDVSRHR